MSTTTTTATKKEQESVELRLAFDATLHNQVRSR